jgi:L-serine dehydratase
MAETGSAAAMAAAGLTAVYETDPEVIFAAAALCLMNTLGLICDPVGGEVEIPCHARNIAGVGHAFTAAAAVLGGFKAVLRFDEVVDAMLAVGRKTCPDFLCTARGGLASTPTARKLAGLP